MQSRFVLAVALSGLFLSCSLLLGCEQPEAEVPLRIVQVSFTNTVILPGETISMAAIVEGSDSVSYRWEADAGEFSSPAAESTDWAAPGLEQLVAVTLSVTADDGRATSFSTDLVVGTGIDHDGDGFSLREGDCDDTNSSIYPGAPDTADGLDNDCDGLLDEGSPDADDDADGFTDLEGDCNDGDTGISPGAEELLNGIDDNCDGRTDEGTDAFDDDGDGYSENEGDCNDQNSGVGPDAPETLDGLDNNCSGETDEGTAAFDDDGDGFTELGGDCNDDPAANGATVFPGSVELLDGTDNDCDGLLDEDFLVDGDGDGWSILAGDCDDADFYSYPGAPEFVDGADNDCNGQVDDSPDEVDNDGDGYSEFEGDCDDTSAVVYPGATEIEDVGLELDNDCNGFYFQNPPTAVASAASGESSASTCSAIVLDGSLSSDPDGDSLVYYWFFDRQPINSALTSAEIRNGASSVATVNPDVPGLWVIGLLVSDGLANSAPSLVSIEVTGSAQLALSLDADCDGVVTADDCDDDDGDVLAFADDVDCDGVLTADDCDDNNVSQPNFDADCDGTATSVDCDDNNPVQPSGDQDCDDVLTGADCDDTNPALLAEADDADCDGVLTDGADGVAGTADDDCDDSPATGANFGSIANDADCDGVVTAADCNDADNTQPTLDADCDGVLADGVDGAAGTLDDDCDDNDSSLLVVGDDIDCDGVLTDGLDGVPGNSDDDCNDNDSSQPNLDADCDGTATAVDCDDTDPTQPSLDADCDGVLADGSSNNSLVDADDDCDDADPALGLRADDADCDGVLADGADGVPDNTDDDCDDSDPALLSEADDADCDGILTAVDCNDSDDTQPALDADCDGVLADGSANGSLLDADDDCDDGDSALGVRSADVDCDGALTATDCDDSDPSIQDSGTGASMACPADSCLEIVTNGHDTGDQLYWLDPDGQGAFENWCDMGAGTGGWTAFYVGTSGSQFAVFEDELDDCSQPASECLRLPPSSLASNAQLGVRCGSTMLSFPMSTALVDYFVSGTQANWQSLGPPTVEDGSYGGDATVSAEFFTGSGALALGWMVSMDAAGTGGIFAGSSPLNAFCNGAADTSSAVYLFYR